MRATLTFWLPVDLWIKNNLTIKFKKIMYQSTYNCSKMNYTVWTNFVIYKILQIVSILNSNTNGFIDEKNKNELPIKLQLCIYTDQTV